MQTSQGSSSTLLLVPLFDAAVPESILSFLMKPVNHLFIAKTKYRVGTVFICSPFSKYWEHTVLYLDTPTQFSFLGISGSDEIS